MNAHLQKFHRGVLKHFFKNKEQDIINKTEFVDLTQPIFKFFSFKERDSSFDDKSLIIDR